MDNRPVKFNPSGKYNTDFIDWNNEWERVGDMANKIENGEELSDKEEEERIKRHMKIDLERFGVKMDKYKVLQAKEIPTNKECYICLKTFRSKGNVIELPCNHLFDEDCLKPWLKSNSTCPVCKYELKAPDNNEEEQNDWY